jgi:hypothetical protein
VKTLKAYSVWSVAFGAWCMVPINRFPAIVILNTIEESIIWKVMSSIQMQHSPRKRHPELVSGSFMQISDHIFFWKAVSIVLFKGSPVFRYKSPVRTSPVGFPLQSGLGTRSHCIKSLTTRHPELVSGSMKRKFNNGGNLISGLKPVNQFKQSTG